MENNKQLTEDEVRNILGPFFWGTTETMVVFDPEHKYHNKDVHPDIEWDVFGKTRLHIPPLNITEEQVLVIKNLGLGIMLSVVGNISLEGFDSIIQVHDMKQVFEYIENVQTRKRLAKDFEERFIHFYTNENEARSALTAKHFTPASPQFEWQIVSPAPLPDSSGKIPVFQIGVLIELYKKISLAFGNSEFLYQNHITHYEMWLASLEHDLPKQLFKFLGDSNLSPKHIMNTVEAEKSYPMNLHFKEMMERNLDLPPLHRAINGACCARHNLEEITVDWDARGRLSQPLLIPYPLQRWFVNELDFKIAHRLCPSPNEIAYQYALRFFNTRTENDYTDLKKTYSQLQTFYPFNQEDLLTTFDYSSDGVGFDHHPAGLSGTQVLFRIKLSAF